MSAIEETHAAGEAGKSTQGGGRPSVGDATRDLSLPHLPYADAVHVELCTVAMPPSSLEARLRRGRTGAPELFLRAVWPAGAPLLDDEVRPVGLTVAWSHVTGWSAHNALGDWVLLNVDVLAAPASIAHAVLHLAEHDLSKPWQPPDGPARWSEAVYLDIALAHFDERPVAW